MSVTRDDVLRVAELAGLELDCHDIEDLTVRMNEILDYVGQMREADADGFRAGPEGRPPEEVLAPDAAGNMLSRDEAMANAPDGSHGLFRVPAFLPDKS